MRTDQDAFEQAKLEWEQLAELWQRGEQRTPAGRRALQGLKDALDALHDYMTDANTYALLVALHAALARQAGNKDTDASCSHSVHWRLAARCLL